MIDLTAFAADELARRKTKAREAIAARRHTEAQAEALLAPWAAMALLLGVAPEALAPDCAEAIADRRIIRLFPGDRAGEADERFARSRLAADLCPPLRWSAALATARDRQFDKAWTERCAHPERSEGPACARAVGLQAMADALDVTAPYRPRANPAHPEEPRSGVSKGTPHLKEAA
jgi:hypothetical protein